jgi:hypothetical protein
MEYPYFIAYVRLHDMFSEHCQDKSLFNSKSTHKSVRRETKRSEYSHYKIEIIKKKKRL